jgi:hypothetical protein
MEHVSVNKQRREQRPDSALFEIVETEDEISLGERRLLLPSPKARPDAGEDQH